MSQGFFDLIKDTSADCVCRMTEHFGPFLFPLRGAFQRVNHDRWARHRKHGLERFEVSYYRSLYSRLTFPLTYLLQVST